MFLMAAAMIAVGGITAQAQVKPVAKTEQTSKPAEKKAKKTTHHAAKKHAAKKEAAATQK